MRLNKFLHEWSVRFEYSGRGMVQKGRTILWMYFTYPELVGLLWTKTDGTILLRNRKIGKMIKPDDNKATHKRLLAEVYDTIGIDKMKGMTGNLREDVENIYEQNVRGRIIGNDIFIWRYGNIDKMDKKVTDRAIDNIYKYIDESLIEGRIVYEAEQSTKERLDDIEKNLTAIVWKYKHPKNLEDLKFYKKFKPYAFWKKMDNIVSKEHHPTKHDEVMKFLRKNIK